MAMPPFAMKSGKGMIPAKKGAPRADASATKGKSANPFGKKSASPAKEGAPRADASATKGKSASPPMKGKGPPMKKFAGGTTSVPTPPPAPLPGPGDTQTSGNWGTGGQNQTLRKTIFGK
jgi:hypothetical protein